jgi:hypothetical protein
MSYEAVTFEKQLKQIDEQEKDMTTAHTDFRVFVLSDDFLKKPKLFQNKISLLEAQTVTLTEETKQALSTVPGGGQGLLFPEQDQENPEQQINHPEASANKLDIIAKAIVLCVIGVISGVLVFTRFIPAIWFVGIIVLAAVFLFFDQAKSIFAYFKGEDKVEETTDSVRLDNWITEGFQWCRERYTSSVCLIDFQTEDRRVLFELTLATEILTHIDRIIVSCRKNVWARKKFIDKCITMQAQAAQAKP